jgi:hypothetical protein
MEYGHGWKRVWRLDVTFMTVSTTLTMTLPTARPNRETFLPVSKPFQRQFIFAPFQGTFRVHSWAYGKGWPWNPYSFTRGRHARPFYALRAGHSWNSRFRGTLLDAQRRSTPPAAQRLWFHRHFTARLDKICQSAEHEICLTGNLPKLEKRETWIQLGNNQGNDICRRYHDQADHNNK